MQVLLLLVIIILLVPGKQPLEAAQKEASPKASEEAAEELLEGKEEDASSAPSKEAPEVPENGRTKKKRSKSHRLFVDRNKDGVNDLVRRFDASGLGLSRKFDYFIDEDGDGIRDGRVLRPGLHPPWFEQVRKGAGADPRIKRKPVPPKMHRLMHRKRGRR